MSPLAVHTKSSDSVDSGSSTDATTPENSVKNEKKKKSIIPKIFSSKRSGKGGSDDEAVKSDGENVAHAEFDKKITAKKQACMEATYPTIGKSNSERSHTSAQIESLNLSNFEQCMVPTTEVEDLRIYVATWNVGGKAPHSGLNLQDFLQVEDASDIYILGFQEIVPLNAGNVLVVEDNEPAAKWLGLISQALNKPPQEFDSEDGSSHSNSIHSKESKSHNFFQKPSLKVLSRNFRADSSLLKTCNCPFEIPFEEKKRVRKLSDPLCKLDSSLESKQERKIDDTQSTAPKRGQRGKISYCLIASKQMVGIFLSVWARYDLVPHIGHLRLTSLGRGIMGRLGNKGCIAITMTLHQTSFCFVCSHLASGEKEGDEVKRNSDVAEILKSLSFNKICKNPNNRAPEKIIDHQRIIWLGDLNYRVALTYEETRILLEDNNWDALLEKDQLNIEKEAGRVFNGFKEGRIFFAPTYKYSHNSDSYAGETVKSKKKRRTPAWCDRILWHGDGIEQLSYIRGESRFSDHRPVCAMFTVEVEVPKKVQRFRKGYSCGGRKLGFEDCIAKRYGFYEV